MLSMHQSDGSPFPRGGMPPLLRLPSGSEHRARPRRLAAVFLFILPQLDEIWTHTPPYTLRATQATRHVIIVLQSDLDNGNIRQSERVLSPWRLGTRIMDRSRRHKV